MKTEERKIDGFVLERKRGEFYRCVLKPDTHVRYGDCLIAGKDTLCRVVDIWHDGKIFTIDTARFFLSHLGEKEFEGGFERTFIIAEIIPLGPINDYSGIWGEDIPILINRGWFFIPPGEYVRYLTESEMEKVVSRSEMDELCSRYVSAIHLTTEQRMY